MKNLCFYFLCFFIACFSKSDSIIIKKYLIENKSIEEIILLPDKKNASILEFEINGQTNKEIVFYYSHFPFKIYNSIKLNGKIKYKFQTDWYDNQCKIRFEMKDKNTFGTINIKLNFL